MIPAAAVAPALILAAVLMVSGVAKLRAPAAVRAAFADLRVPAGLDRAWVRAAFPVGEAALGAALPVVPGPAAPFVAGLAVLLFAAYWVLIRRALGFADPVSCACFGESDAAPVTRRTLLRNTVLLLLALAWWGVTWSASGPALLARFTAADALWLAGGLLGAAVVWLARPGASAPAPGLVPGPGTALAVGTAPDAATVTDPAAASAPGPQIPHGLRILDAEGREAELAGATSSGGARLLLHISPGCASCARVVREAPARLGRLGPVRLQLISLARPEAVRVVVPEALWPGLLQAGDQAAVAALGIPAAPSAVLVGGGGEILAGPVAGPDAVLALLDRLTAGRG